MIEKINELKSLTNSKEVIAICENALVSLSSTIYNSVTSDAKYEIEKITMTNLFKDLSKHDIKEVNEWVSNQKRLFTVKNLGVREAISTLNESKELNHILEQFKDAINNGVHESRLYEQFISALSPFGYFPTVGNAIESIKDRVEKYKSDVDIMKILETMKETRSNYLVPLIEDVINNYLNNKTSQSRSQLSETLMKFTYDPFVRDIASLITLDATELQLEYANAQCDIDKVYSPIMYIGENEAVFSVNNVYYIKKGNNINRLGQTDIMQLDEEFKTLCETLSKPNIEVGKNGVVVYFDKDKAIINESGVVINDKKLTNEEFKSAAQVSDWVGNRGLYQLVEFLRSNYNEIAEIDFVKRVYLKEDVNYAADVFKCRDNVFITTHNPELGKSTFYRNVNPIQAKNIMMEHLRFDVTSIYKGLLPDEDKINEQIQETKDSYNEYITDLTNKINEFKSTPYKKDVTSKVVIALQEELQDVKNEYKDYLNHIEKYLRAESVNETITIDINVDGKTYTVPIPQEKIDVAKQETSAQGTVVGYENIVDTPALAITFDDDQTELIGDTPTIPEDQIDLGSDEAEQEADEVEQEAEEETETEDELQDVIDSGDDIKIEDEADIDQEDKDELKSDDEEEEEKKKKEQPLESSEGQGLKKKKFITEAGETDEKKKKKVFLKKKVTESVVEKKKSKLNESAQIGDTVIFNKQKGSVIGQIGDDLIVQVQGSSNYAKQSDVNVVGAKVETLKPPFKFSKETQKLLFEQYVRCGIFMENTPIKTTDCFVRFSDWKDAKDLDPVNVIIEGQSTLLNKDQIRIFEDANNFANLDNYVEGVEIDESTGEAISNIQINVIDYTEAIGDADPVRIIRAGNGTEPTTDTVPKATVRTLSI